MGLRSRTTGLPPQQVGGGEDPLFYVAPPDGENFFARYASSYLQRRTRVADQFLQARIRAADPTARAQLLLQIAQQRAGLIRSAQQLQGQLARSGTQQRADILRERSQLIRNRERIRSDESRKRAEIRSAERRTEIQAGVLPQGKEDDKAKLKTRAGAVAQALAEGNLNEARELNDRLQGEARDFAEGLSEPQLLNALADVRDAGDFLEEGSEESLRFEQFMSRAGAGARPQVRGATGVGRTDLSESEALLAELEGGIGLGATPSVAVEPQPLPAETLRQVRMLDDLAQRIQRDFENPVIGRIGDPVPGTKAFQDLVLQRAGFLPAQPAPSRRVSRPRLGRQQRVRAPDEEPRTEGGRFLEDIEDELVMGGPGTTAFFPDEDLPLPQEPSLMDLLEEQTRGIIRPDEDFVIEGELIEEPAEAITFAPGRPTVRDLPATDITAPALGSGVTPPRGIPTPGLDVIQQQPLPAGAVSIGRPIPSTIDQPTVGEGMAGLPPLTSEEELERIRRRLLRRGRR